MLGNLNLGDMTKRLDETTAKMEEMNENIGKIVELLEILVRLQEELNNHGFPD